MVRWFFLVFGVFSSAFYTFVYAAPICEHSASDACLERSYTGAAHPDALSVFERVSEITTECFYDQTFRGLDWKAEVGKARSEISVSSSEVKLKEVLKKLLTKLNASHTEFLSASDQRYWALESVFSGKIGGAPLWQIGAFFEQIQGRWFIRAVLEDSPAFHAGLKRGDAMVTAGAKPFSPVTSFSAVKPGQCIRVVYQRRKFGVLHDVCITPRFESLQQSMLKAGTASEKVFKKAKKRIGYFHLWAGTHERFKQQLEAVAEKMELTTDALILDIRDGLGGASADFLDPFLKSKVFSRPLYLLINEGSKSGKETLAYLLKTGKRATLIGTQTAGAYLGGRLFDMVKGKYALYLAVCGDAPAKVKLEGVGVTPHYLVKAPLPYAQGKDPQLEYAIQFASKK